MADKPDGFWKIASEILGLAAAIIGIIVLIHPLWTPLILLAAIVLLTVLLRGYRRRERLRNLVEFMPTTQANLSPVQLGAKPSPISKQRFSDQRPPYIPRPPFEDKLDAELRSHRSVIIKGVTNAGKSHAIFEAIGRMLPRHRVVVPKEPYGGVDPLVELLASNSPLPRGHRYVLVVNDLDARLSAIGSVAIPRWLGTHGGARFIATVSSEHWGELIRMDASNVNRASARQLSKIASLTLSPEFRGSALAEARTRYHLPSGKTKLGEFLAKAEVTVNRLDVSVHANPAGRALALSAINCARAGLARPIALSKLIEMSRRVTSGDGHSFSEADWDRAVEYCIGRTPDIADLLHLAETGEDPSVTANPAVVEHADRESQHGAKPTELPAHIWEAVIAVIAESLEDKVAIGRAAAWRGRPDLAERLLQEVYREESSGSASRIAAELLKDPDPPLEEGPVGGMLRRVSIGPDLDRPSGKWARALSRPSKGSPFDASIPSHSRWRDLYSHRVERDAIRFTVLLFFDVTAVLSGILLAHALGTLTLSRSSGGHLTPTAALSAAVLVFIFFLLFGLYRSDRERARLGEIIKGVGLVAISLSALALGEGYGVTNLPLALLATVAAMGLVYLFRWLYDMGSRSCVKRTKLQSRALLVDSDRPAATGSLLLHCCRRPMQIIGYLAPKKIDSGWLGSTDDLESVARANRVDRLIIADKGLSAEQRRALIYRAHTIDLAVELVPSPAELIQGATDSLDELLVPLIAVRPLYLTYVDRVTKRAIDITLALLLGLIVALPLAVIAMVLKLRSSEPVIVRKLRPGLSALYFGMLRLRTYERGKPTPLGQFLKRWRIDELPQLLNVLAGTMSIVGPRPIDDEAFKDLDEFQQARYVVRPGITGLWQISRRNHSLEEMTNLDLSYCRKWTPLLDLTILLRTVPAVAFDRGQDPMHL